MTNSGFFYAILFYSSRLSVGRDGRLFFLTNRQEPQETMVWMILICLYCMSLKYYTSSESHNKLYCKTRCFLSHTLVIEIKYAYAFDWMQDPKQNKTVQMIVVLVQQQLGKLFWTIFSGNRKRTKRSSRVIFCFFIFSFQCSLNNFVIWLLRSFERIGILAVVHLLSMISERSYWVIVVTKWSSQPNLLLCINNKF